MGRKMGRGTDPFGLGRLAYSASGADASARPPQRLTFAVVLGPDCGDELPKERLLFRDNEMARCQLGVSQDEPRTQHRVHRTRVAHLHRTVGRLGIEPRTY